MAGLCFCAGVALKLAPLLAFLYNWQRLIYAETSIIR